MKRILSITLTCLLLILSASTPAYAAEESTDSLGYSYYTETITIINSSDSGTAVYGASQFITGTKTCEYKNANGDVVWSVSITAGFTYNGSSVRCLNHTPSAVSYYPSLWTIKSTSSTMSTASATGTAVATYRGVSGITHDYTASVTICCSENGTLS